MPTARDVAIDDPHDPERQPVVGGGDRWGARPASLVSNTGPVSAPTVATAASGTSLASTGAPLLLEVLLGLGLLALGLAISRTGRRTNGKGLAE